MGRKKITQYTRYGTVLLSFIQATGIALWLEKQSAPGGAPLVPHPGLGFRSHDGPDAHDGNDVHHVARRADHRARDRQRHLAHHLRRHRRRAAARDLRPLPAAAEPDHLDPDADRRPRLHDRDHRPRSSSSSASQRRIPVQYAKRVVGRRVYGGQNTYLPLRVNTGGVIPIIFAISILQLPAYLRADLGRGLDEERGGVALDGAPALPAALRCRDPLLLLLLHVDRLQPDGHGRQHAQVRRIHPGHPARQEDGRLHRHGPLADHDRRRDLPDVRRPAARHPQQRLQGRRASRASAPGSTACCRGSSRRASGSTSTSAAPRS